MGIRNVLQALFAGVGDGNIELAPHLPVCVLGQADAARRRDLLKPSRDIDAVAEHVALVDDYVADMDADPKFDAVAGRDVPVALCHSALHRHGARDRLDHRREPEQQAVARGLDDVSLVRGNERIDQLLAMAFQRQVSAFFVRAHEARIAHHVGGDDRSKVTLYRGRRHN